MVIYVNELKHLVQLIGPANPKCNDVFYMKKNLISSTAITIRLAS